MKKYKDTFIVLNPITNCVIKNGVDSGNLDYEYNEIKAPNAYDVINQ